jgi:tetratricopeptide (TPR) repeat protein
LVKAADDDVAAGNFDAALGKLRKGIAAETDKNRKKDLLIREAKLNLFKGRVGYGRFRLNKLCRQEFYAPAFIAAAQSYMYFEPYDRAEAKKRVDRILRKDPQHVNALIEKGYVDLYLLQYKSAMASFTKARKLDKYATRAFYGQADVHVKQGKHMKGIHVLQDCLRLQPESGETMLRIGDIYLGSKIIRKTDAAISWYERAMAFANGRPKYYSRIMMGFFVRRTAGNAKPYFEQLKKISPNGSYTKWAEAVFAELAGKLSTAKNKYEEAVALDRQNWLAQFGRANIYAARGTEEFVQWAKTMKYKYDVHKNYPKGIEAYKTILNNAPTFPYYKTAEMWYQKLIETPSVDFWTDPANEEKLQKIKRFGDALKLGCW